MYLKENETLEKFTLTNNRRKVELSKKFDSHI